MLRARKQSYNLSMRIAAALLLLCLPSLAASQAPGAKEIFEEGQEAQRAGNYQLAAAKFAEALRLDPQLIAARANLAVAYSSLGRFDEAIEQYQLALARFPENFDLRRNLALVYYKKGAFAEAAALFLALVKLVSSDFLIFRDE
jgi:superkiller protein 3